MLIRRLCLLLGLCSGHITMASMSEPNVNFHAQMRFTPQFTLYSEQAKGETAKESSEIVLGMPRARFSIFGDVGEHLSYCASIKFEALEMKLKYFYMTYAINEMFSISAGWMSLGVPLVYNYGLHDYMHSPNIRYGLNWEKGVKFQTKFAEQEVSLFVMNSDNHDVDKDKKGAEVANKQEVANLNMGIQFCGSLIDGMLIPIVNFNYRPRRLGLGETEKRNWYEWSFGLRSIFGGLTVEGDIMQVHTAKHTVVGAEKTTVNPKREQTGAFALARYNIDDGRYRPFIRYTWVNDKSAGKTDWIENGVSAGLQYHPNIGRFNLSYHGFVHYTTQKYERDTDEFKAGYVSAKTSVGIGIAAEV